VNTLLIRLAVIGTPIEHVRAIISDLQRELDVESIRVSPVQALTRGRP
jgi:hypothetical protein